MTSPIYVTLCASAYTTIDLDRRIALDSDLIADILPINEEHGIGKAIIMFHDGSSANVNESADEICSMINGK
jgi:hypothetical protein